MRILHISDFHFEDKNLLEYTDMVKSLCEAVKDKSIDIIVFSGDLVYKATDRKYYDKVDDLLWKPLLAATGLSINEILLVPGNHDVNRDVEIPAITASLQDCNSWDSLNDFLKSNRQLELSLERMKYYMDYVHDFYNGSTFEVTPFHVTNIIEIKGRKIGLVGLNSAWRCFYSNTDRGNLLLPKDAVLDSLVKVEGCDIVMCAMHHNLSDFKDFVTQDIEDLIYEHCHLLLTGHYHKGRMSMHEAKEIGLLHNIAPATINLNDKTSKFGFDILDIEDDYTVGLQSYFKEGSSYIEGKERHQQIPMSDEKQNANKFRKSMRRLYQDNLKKADSLFVTGHDTDQNEAYGFKNLFTSPIIKDKSYQEILASKRKGNSMSIENLLNNDENYIFFGLDKCGKTSLLWKILLDTLLNYDTLQTIPVLLDCTELKKGRQVNIKTELARTLSMNKRSTENILSRYQLMVLLDNFDYKEKIVIEQVEHSLKGVDNFRMLACSEERLSSGFDRVEVCGKTFSKLYIHSVTHREIHQLTLKWPNISLEKKRDFEEKIVQIFEQMHIPFNYWTASLFLWILEKTDEANIHNNFELVQLYIDELLHRKGIVKYNELNIQYDDLLSYLGCLAERLLSEFDDDYSMSYAQWANFTEEHIAKHQKYTENVENTLSTLLRIGVMYKTPHERYTFRLKGVFEYFLAYQMSKDEAFKKKVMEEEHFYLSFGNEFELYSGFKKYDFEFPRFIFSKTKEILSPLTALPDYNAIDDRLKNDVMSISKLMSSVNKLITKIENFVETGDDYCPMSTQHLIETSKVEKKKYYDKIDPTTENVEKALFILARVYRNSNICDCTEDKTADEILDFLLTGTCNLGLMFMNNFEGKVNLDDLQAQDLIKIVMQYMPLMVETFLYDAVAQKNLSRIFEEKLKELKMNPHGNSFRIFLLTFVLVDLDINKYYNLIDDLNQYIGKGILRYATYGKLCVLCFKNNSNSALSESLIQKAKFLGSQFIEGNIEKALRKNISDKSLKEKNDIRQRNIDY